MKKIILILFITLSVTAFAQNNNKRDSVTIYSPPHHDTLTIKAPGQVYTVVQTPPKFNGNMNKYIRKNLIYPPDAKEKKVKGTVYVMVVVETDGSLSNISVVHSPDMSLSKEAGRVISSMPKWEPGMQNGHPVRVQQLIPVEFKI